MVSAPPRAQAGAGGRQAPRLPNVRVARRSLQAIRYAWLPTFRAFNVFRAPAGRARGRDGRRGRVRACRAARRRSGEKGRQAGSRQARWNAALRQGRPDARRRACAVALQGRLRHGAQARTSGASAVRCCPGPGSAPRPVTAPTPRSGRRRP